MNGEIEILDRLSIVAPLGIRFRDAVTNAVIDDGLSVVAYPSDNPLRRIGARTNRKGVYFFRDLPGLREVENASGDAEFWASLTGERPFVIEVIDDRGRYQPFLLNIDLPVKGLYRWDAEPSGSPPAPEAPVPLFPTSSRQAPAGTAVVRAALWDPVADQPAAWALVDAVVDGIVRARGIADANGQLALMFPYPEPKDPSSASPVSSPLTSDRMALVDQTWSLKLQGFYSPVRPVPKIPDLGEVIRQTPGSLWSALSPPAELSEQTLEFGRELIVKSNSESILWITSESSPS
jgi:hypothetical protein